MNIKKVLNKAILLHENNDIEVALSLYNSILKKIIQTDDLIEYYENDKSQKDFMYSF